MSRIRIVVKSQPDRKEDLRIAGRARSAIYDALPVHPDPDYPLQSVHRNVHGRAFLEVSGASRKEVEDVLAKSGLSESVVVSETDEPLGEECANCGNIAGPVLPTVCPNCGFRDISPYPYDDLGDKEVPRKSYVKDQGDVFRCLETNRRVRLRFNEPLVKEDGTYNQPLVVVEKV